jgi:hypothetical protein
MSKGENDLNLAYGNGHCTIQQINLANPESCIAVCILLSNLNSTFPQSRLKLYWSFQGLKRLVINIANERCKLTDLHSYLSPVCCGRM